MPSLGPRQSLTVGKIFMTLLGELSPKTFLETYWQRQALVVRDALPNWGSPLSGDELAGLSLEPDVASRLVRSNSDQTQWSVAFGPFDESDFANLPESDWSLLVQATDLWVPEIAALKRQFHFLPSWRLDDIMVSFVPPGGSVGPHFDQYDVFLIQVEGRRHWKIGQTCDQNTPLLDGTDLSILADFVTEAEYTLSPGDMLYLPPGVAHHGVALDNCLTYSVGFRAPTLGEMISDLATDLVLEPDQLVYRDPDPSLWTEDNITDAHIDQVQSLVQALANDRVRLTDWFARYVTRPKHETGTTPINEHRTAETQHARYLNGNLKE